jgi:hypothetical protein
MRRTPVAPVAVAAAAALVAVAVAAPRARADEKEACVAASDQAQTLRDEGKYRAARLQLLACSRDACPGLVRHDCEKWLSDLDANQPTVVLGARDPKGTDAPSTRVLLDGAVLTSHLDGKPIAVDPGEHTFRYEATGAAPVEQHAVIRVGEKNRMLTAVVMPLAPSAASLAPPSTAESAAEPATHGLRVPPVSIALASLGGVAAVSFAYFGLSGRSDVSDLRATCAPNCTQSQVDSAHTKLIVADVSLGVGIVALAGAAWFFFTSGSQGSPQSAMVRADVEPRPGGGVASLSARF